MCPDIEGNASTRSIRRHRKLLTSLEETVTEPANAARAASIEQDKERLRSLHRQSGRSGKQTINSSSACKAPSTVEAKNVVEVKKQ